MKRFSKFHSGIAALALAGMTFIGCGSDNSSDDGATAETSVNSGYFVDAAVEGVAYETSSGLTGVTDVAGKFLYKNGDTVEFRIGNLVLGQGTPQNGGLVTPADLTADANATTLMLRVLQSLDADGNVSNGIRIDPAIVTAMEQIQERAFETLKENDLLGLSGEFAQAIDEDNDGHVDVNETEALGHFEESTRQWHSEHDDAEEMLDLASYATGTLSQETKDTLAFMGSEERLAYDLYQALYTYHLQETSVELKQLYNIANRSESQHIDIVQWLIDRYDLQTRDVTVLDNQIQSDGKIEIDEVEAGTYEISQLQSLYDSLIAKGKTSPQDALEVGCMVEVTDVEDLDQAIVEATNDNAEDIVAAYTILRAASYNHYWAFDQGLKNMGVVEGCCAAGASYCKTPQEFPQDSTVTP